MDFLLIHMGTKDLEIQEILDRLLVAFEGSTVELIKIETLRPVEVVGWWIGLPNRTPLKVIHPTKIWRDLNKSVSFSTIEEKYTLLDYWNKVVDMGGYKMAKVFDKPELWVDVEDVRPA